MSRAAAGVAGWGWGWVERGWRVAPAVCEQKVMLQTKSQIMNAGSHA